MIPINVRINIPSTNSVPGVYTVAGREVSCPIAVWSRASAGSAYFEDDPRAQNLPTVPTCHRRVLGIVFTALLLIPGLAVAQDSMPLSQYLERGRDAGVNIIYSSTLVNPSQRIEVDASLPFSVEYLREAAGQWGLVLEAVANNSYLLRELSIPSDEPPQESVASSTESLVIEEVVVHSSRYSWSRQLGSAAVLSAEELIKLQRSFAK